MEWLVEQLCNQAVQEFKCFCIIPPTLEWPREGHAELQLTRSFTIYLTTAIQGRLNDLVNRPFKGSRDLWNDLVNMSNDLLNSL